MTATPWLIASKSCASCASVKLRPLPSGLVVIEKWKAEGMRTAITAIRSKEEFSWLAVVLMVCSAKRKPPAKKHLLRISAPTTGLREKRAFRERGEDSKGSTQQARTARRQAHTMRAISAVDVFAPS